LPENIMARSILLFSLLLCVSAASRAGDVHKCVTPTGISYQSAPCAGPELPTSTVIASATQDVAGDAGERGGKRARAHHT
jgi:hypothetical protein